MSTKHNLIQERLNLKRAPLDEWNTHEQLCLASAVACSGDQNWMSVSRALKGIVNNYSSRPADWFVSKSCATQYGKLFESVETPKRKKRTASERDQPVETPSTPVESLVKKLTAERIVELKEAITEDQQEYAKLKEEILFLQSSSMDEARIREMWNQIEQEKIQKEREQVRYDQWLKEREEKKIELERQWRPNFGMNKSPNVVKTQKSVQEDMETDSTQQQAGTSSTPSPLLTSLLKSSHANQSPPIQPSDTARLAPTITNLLTGSPSKSSSPSSKSPLITQSSTNSQNNLINSSVSVANVPNIVINHSASSVQIPVSQTAPTLITLLDKKPQTSTGPGLEASIIEKQQLMMSISVPESSSGKDCGDIAKDEEAELLADFSELIAAKDFDDEDLEDINSIIMNPEILEDKISEDEPIKDVDDSSQATSTDDYDKLKIKQLVEDFAGVPVEQSPAPQEDNQEQVIKAPGSVEECEVIQVPSEPETSNPDSIELIEPVESNDSKTEVQQNDDKVMIISDESSNNSSEKKDQSSDKIEANKGEESQSLKTSLADDVKNASAEDSKEKRNFQNIQENKQNSGISSKEVNEAVTVYQVEDSDEDVLFEDAKEHHESSSKTEKVSESETKSSAKIAEVQDSKSSKATSIEVEEVTRSRGSVDSDDEFLEAKISRSTGRKKANESIKIVTPISSTRSRDHSENDDKDAKPIRTRSRHSSVIPSGDQKSTFNFPKEQDHSMWKARWEDCHKELQKLKDFHTIVDNKLIADDSYKRVVLRPMNMKLIQKNIDNNVSTLPGDVKRDFALMCTNIIMSSKKGSKFEDLVQQFIRDGMAIIDSNMDVEDVYKSYRKQVKKKH